MKTAHLVVLYAFTVFLVSLPSGAGEKTTYRHPELEFQFEAPAGWKAIPHAEDRLIYPPGRSRWRTGGDALVY